MKKTSKKRILKVIPTYIKIIVSLILLFTFFFVISYYYLIPKYNKQQQFLEKVCIEQCKKDNFCHTTLLSSKKIAFDSRAPSCDMIIDEMNKNNIEGAILLQGMCNNSEISRVGNDLNENLMTIVENENCKIRRYVCENNCGVKYKEL